MKCLRGNRNGTVHPLHGRRQVKNLRSRLRSLVVDWFFFSGWCRLSFWAPQVSQGIREPTLARPIRGSNWLKGLGPRVEREKKEFPGLPPPRNLHYIKPYSLAAWEIPFSVIATVPPKKSTRITARLLSPRRNSYVSKDPATFNWIDRRLLDAYHSSTYILSIFLIAKRLPCLVYCI